MQLRKSPAWQYAIWPKDPAWTPLVSDFCDGSSS